MFEYFSATDDRKDLAAALVRAQTNMGAAVKDSKNPHFRSSYASLTAVIHAVIPTLNAQGIAVLQMPHIDEEVVLHAINPNKDVDGFHPTNFGKMALGMETFIPATPFGIMELLKRYKLDISGKHAVVIGRRHIVGRPMSILLSEKGNPGNATVTLTHSRTQNLAAITKEADIVVSALGVPNFLTADMVKDGAIIIDVGITRVPDVNHPKGYVIVGDVHYDAVKEKASYITPVPGGVGPMTIAMLLQNTMLAYQRNQD